MLQRIRDNSSGPLAYAVVAVIVLVFGVWGIGSYLTPPSQKPVATVSGSDISKPELRQAVKQRYKQLKTRLGEQFDPDQVLRSDMRRAALQQLVQSRLVSQYAKDVGYQVSDADVLAALKQKSAFQDNDVFSTKRYHQVLERAGLEPSRYEARLRQQLWSRIVGLNIQSNAFAVPRAVTSAYSRQREKRRLAVLRFDPSSWQSDVRVSDKAIRAAYKRSDGRYQDPARVKLSYVALNADEVTVDVDLNRDRLKQIYKQNSARFRTLEKRAGGVIRVAIEDADPSAARTRVQRAAKKLDSGQTMQQVAGSISGAAYQKLASTSRQDADQSIAKLLFQTEQDEYANPVQESNAWLIVRPTEVTAASQESFDQPSVQETVKTIARSKARDDAFQSRRKKLGDLAYQAPNSLQTVADKLDLKIEQSDWISRRKGQGLGANEAVRKAAFSSDVRKKDLNSGVIKLGNKRAVVVRAADTEAGHKKPLSKVRSQVVADLKQNKAGDKAHEAANQARKRLAEGQSTLQKLASSNDRVTLDKAGLIARSSDALAESIKRAAFSVAPQESDTPALTVSETDQGVVALVAVEDVQQPGQPETELEKRRHQLVAQRQRRYMGALEYGAFSDWLRQTRTVTIHEDALKPGAGQGS